MGENFERGKDVMNNKYIVCGGAVLLCVIFIALCVALASPAKAAYDEPQRVTTAKQDALHDCAEILRWVGYTDDSAAIKALQAAWWEEQENLDIIAKVIQNEADPAWCEWEHSVAVGAVVCNRVASPYFPDTVREVVAQPGQYLKIYTYGFENTSRLAYLAAKAALDGDHDVPSDAYWQDTHRQGVSVWKAFQLDTGYYRSTTYICCGIPGVG